MSQNPTQPPSNSELTLSSQRQLILTEDRQLWERQPEESDTHWGWFQLYRDMHPSVRTVGAAYNAYKELEVPETITRSSVALRPPTWFQQVATDNHWVTRAKAYDEWADADMLERLQSTRVRHLVEVADIGRALRLKAEEALAVLEVVAYEMIIDEEGNPKTIEVSSLSPAAIAQLARIGVDLERDALSLGRGGQAGGLTVNIANVVGGGAASRLPNPDGDDRLLDRVAEIVRHRQEQSQLTASVEPDRQGDDERLVTVKVTQLPQIEYRPGQRGAPRKPSSPGEPPADRGGAQ